LFHVCYLWMDRVHGVQYCFSMNKNIRLTSESTSRLCLYEKMRDRTMMRVDIAQGLVIFSNYFRNQLELGTMPAGRLFCCLNEESRRQEEQTEETQLFLLHDIILDFSLHESFHISSRSKYIRMFIIKALFLLLGIFI